MKIQPQFSGVYLKPTDGTPRKPSRTGYEQFDHQGRSYYTTNEDTVTLYRAKRDKMPKEQLNELYGTLAEKASPATVPNLAGIIASRITESSARSERSGFQPRALARVIAQGLEEKDVDRVEISSPRRELLQSGLDERVIDEVEIGLKSLNKQG